MCLDITLILAINVCGFWIKIVMQHSRDHLWFYNQNFFTFHFHSIYRSSSLLGMSNISANNGGNLMCVQFVLSQSKCVQCLAPRPEKSQCQRTICWLYAWKQLHPPLSSGILASNAGINCNDTVDPGRDRTICTRSASAIFSRIREICLCSVMPDRCDVSSTNAENRPTSVSLRPNPFRLVVKLWNAVTNSFCSIVELKR